MNRVLITGATGNIGKEVVQYLNNTRFDSQLVLAVRAIDKAKKVFNNVENVEFRVFDFENSQTFNNAFCDIDILFLLRPPHISEVDKYFKPLLEAAKKNKINKVVFLSVQGAEKSKVIPHNKIERLITTLGFQYIFVRPSYFMQNLTTSLLHELQHNKSITLPSGNAKFNWIDVKNIGVVTAELINSFEKHKNSAFEITGTENLSFGEVVEIMNKLFKSNFKYIKINPVSFYFKKKKEGMPGGFAAVMTILHFLPRLQKEPEISNNFYLITKNQTTALSDFLISEEANFLIDKKN